jgi:Yip1-like protein
VTTSTRRFVVPGIVFGVGLLLIVAAVLKVVGFGPGIALCFLALVLFGLSFIRQPSVEDAPPPMPFLQKLTNIFFEPSAVFRNLRAHPHWFGALLISTLLSFAYSTAFVQRLTPERIVNFTTDKVAEQFTSIPPEQIAQMKAQGIAEAKSPGKVAGGAVTTFVGGFVLACFAAGLYMLLVLIFGGRLGFWPALATAVWAALPATLIGKVLSLVLLYVKDPDDIHPVRGGSGLVTDNLGLLVNASEHPVLFVVLSFFGVLSIYSLWLPATGLRHTSERLSSGSAWTIAIIFWILLLLVATGFTALFSGFIT